MLSVIIASVVSSIGTRAYLRMKKPERVQMVKCSRLIQESGRAHPCEGIRIVKDNQLFDWEREAAS